ncbi:MAG: penicillin-binding transpeptidase domain-containing protein [candidate division KSB1 bacterium]|nr:penicillin-binding transpeptidase domain-containing protein [candidate division KSB1 bacterium]MDZ7365310.1 penicillin-binding transpeptidase domain-containing protein [candidate division KSB1 bacterium]
MVLTLILFLFFLPCCNQPSENFSRLLAFRKKCVEILGTRSGAILVMNPNNGLLLAVVNEKLGVKNSTRPGSTFKIITALTLLKNGLINPTDKFICNGQIEIRGKVYRCWLREGHGKQNLMQALANSCNVYFYQAGARLSPEKLTASARQFHLGECTDVNFSNEDGGKIPQWVSEEEQINFLVGQARSLAATPLQILALISVVANGGFYYRPFYPTSPKEFEMFRPDLKGTIHFGDELGIVKEGLRQSAAYGTSAAVKLPQIRVAGKTGTSSGYFGAKTDAWFAGFAPFEKPEIVVVVFLENGRGAMDAAPIAREVLASYFVVFKTR